MPVNPLTVAMVGLSLFEGITGASSSREMARRGKESVEEQMKLLNRQRRELEQLYAEKGEIVTDVYGNKVTNLLERTGLNLTDISDRFDAVASRSGLAFSGTAERRRDLSERRTTLAYKSDARSLYDKLVSDRMDLDIAKSREFGNIDIQLAGLEGQADIYEAQANQRFLGIF